MFSSVKAHISTTLPPSRRAELKLALERNGGNTVPISAATHIISNTINIEGADETPIVTDLWVDRSMVLGEPLPPEFYSADPGKIFSGIVATASGISPTDFSTLKSGITAMGGVWRAGLTRDVTHLFATTPTSEKYAVAIKHGITTLLPHWFDDAIRLSSGKLPTAPYQWPDPPMLKALPTTEKSERKPLKLSLEKHIYFKTAVWDPALREPCPAVAKPSGDDVWNNRRVLLSHTLNLNSEQRASIEAAVKIAGGTVVRAQTAESDALNVVLDAAEAKKMSSTDVFVTRWRAGMAYTKAVELGGVLIGTVQWLLFVHGTGVVSSPRDQLLHFPIRMRSAGEGFTDQVITITNYSGEIREYLKVVIRQMGAEFTPNMTGSNTMLLAAFIGGIKTAKAISWSLPVVNHLWLEDCFSTWRFVNPAAQKYLEFPPHVDFAPMLAERRFPLPSEDLLSDGEDSVPSQRPVQPVGTEASTKEVEGLLSAVDGDDLDAEHHPSSRKISSRDEVPESVSPNKPRISHNPTPKKRPLESPSKRPRQELASNPPKVNGKQRSLFSDDEDEVEAEPEPPKRTNGAQSENKASSSKTLLTPNGKRKAPPARSQSPPPAKRARTATSGTSVAHGTAQASSSKGKTIVAPSGPGAVKITDLRTGTVAAKIAAVQRQKRIEPDDGESEPDEGDGDVEMVSVEEVTKPKRAPRTRTKTAETSNQSAPSKTAAKGKGKDKAGAKNASTSSSGSLKRANKICLMTTSINLPTGVPQKLAKLGVKITKDPTECTHLIAPSIVRTEKFLGALARRAWILSKDWALDSAAANKLLAEKDYILSDPASEEKWGFKLRDAMKRAQDVGGEVFKGMTFYATRNVKVDQQMLRTVIEAQGGKYNKTQSPTVRMMNSVPGRYLITCADDEQVWRAIARHNTVYSLEFILLSALRQELAHDEEEAIVSRAQENEDES
ncbi:hypothetical protein MKEN_01429800 [Mycena kentingensis (nom. inval.)]|nr:hypothetical protein MKEN_01429800 [Mycena kentingensis (nom. inval.)]